MPAIGRLRHRERKIMTMTDNQQNAAAAKNGINRPVFDILRVTAAAMVFMIHFAGYRNLPKPQFVFMLFRHFNFGVCMFFVMSGYLIMQSVDASRNVKEYFVKRVSRIIPAYYAIIVFAIIVWDIILGQMPKDTMLGIGWLRYFLFLNGIIPSAEYYYWNDLWGLWTMSCFMLFYILAPVIRKLVKSYRASLVFMCVIVVLAYGYKAVYSHFLNINNVPWAAETAGDCAVFNLISFAFGTAAWYAVREGKEKNYMRIVIAALACFLAMREDTFNRIIWSLLTVAFMLSMKDFAYSDKTKRIGNIFSALAKYSFTVYLVHMPVIELTEYFSEHIHYLGYFAFLGIVLAVTAVMTALLHCFVEIPFAKLIKRRFACQK